ncbi:uncharacterized protein CC84DRAFT_211818 [Paraphaeosphaeria sporulosa]|uniref:Uncharacterized protein n=1 Tax=Paraphaeosphaeria sporulosa TaxID=1460663 RepID=A0A177C1P8_9PLEO|nr:uncharacterized protein CC84DRAFT_211818 [Paraphaeosphaeria sporulosa]OAG01704.1 hypothetical protein CC84DRAFT_211818 [Paraphaeosphaeria sporulosa]
MQCYRLSVIKDMHRKHLGRIGAMLSLSDRRRAIAIRRSKTCIRTGATLSLGGRSKTCILVIFNIQGGLLFSLRWHG